MLIIVVPAFFIEAVQPLPRSIIEYLFGLDMSGFIYVDLSAELASVKADAQPIRYQSHTYDDLVQMPIIVAPTFFIDAVQPPPRSTTEYLFGFDMSDIEDVDLSDDCVPDKTEAQLNRYRIERLRCYRTLADYRCSKLLRQGHRAFTTFDHRKVARLQVSRSDDAYKSVGYRQVDVYIDTYLYIHIYTYISQTLDSSSEVYQSRAHKIPNILPDRPVATMLTM